MHTHKLRKKQKDLKWGFLSRYGGMKQDNPFQASLCYIVSLRASLDYIVRSLIQSNKTRRKQEEFPKVWPADNIGTSPIKCVPSPNPGHLYGDSKKVNNAKKGPQGPHYRLADDPGKSVVSFSLSHLG